MKFVFFLTLSFSTQKLPKTQGKNMSKYRKPVLSFFIEAETGCFRCVDRFFDKDGYPRCRMNGENVSASRYVYSMIHGKIEDGMVIRHKCDNPKCINPLHLEIGTHADNMKDRDERGRGAGCCVAK